MSSDISKSRSLLIEPFGIEMCGLRGLIVKLKLLIEPFGIEIRHAARVLFSVDRF